MEAQEIESGADADLRQPEGSSHPQLPEADLAPKIEASRQVTYDDRERFILSEIASDQLTQRSQFRNVSTRRHEVRRGGLVRPQFRTFLPSGQGPLSALKRPSQTQSSSLIAFVKRS
jgi:hypothetical protein